MTPLSLINDAEASALIVVWADGLQQRLPHNILRATCPCAHCRRRRLSEGEQALPASAGITALQVQGYGVQILFTDGHDRGIYPWPYLRGLTAC